MRKKIKNRIYLGLLFILAVAILLFPLFMRVMQGNPVISGEGYYLDLRISEDLSINEYWDTIQDRPYKVSFFHYVLILILSVVTVDSLIVISVILGLISLFVFYSIIKHYFPKGNTALLSAYLLAVSPIFVFLFTRFHTYTFATFLSLIFLYLVSKNSYWSFPLIALISITNPLFALVNLILLLFLFLQRKEKHILWTNIVTAVFSFFLFYYFHPTYTKTMFFFSPSFAEYFTSFGAPIGIAFFYLFLGGVGFFVFWQRRSEYILLYLSIVTILVISMFHPVARIFLNFYLALLASVLIVYLLQRKWAIPAIKQYTLLLIVCSIIFSSALYLDQLIDAEPSDELLLAINSLESQEWGAVLSDQDYGHFIQYFANKPTLTDQSSQIYKDYFKLVDDEQTMFYSRDLTITKDSMNENGIKYVLVSPKMKDGRVWSRSDEGLLFLLGASDDFNRLYKKNGYETYVLLPVS